MHLPETHCAPNATASKALRRATLLTLLLLTAASVRAQGIDDYTLIDSNAAFTSIASTGTRLTALAFDDTSTRVDLPFVFRFAGVEYSHIMVSTNAQIGLGDNSPTATGYFTYNLDNMDIIVPLGHDQNMNPSNSQGGGNVYYLVTGTSPNRRMIIEYKRLLPYTGYRQNRYTFQVHLLENGDIWFLYDTVVAARRQSDNYTFLRSHTTGTALFVTGTWDSITLKHTADSLPLYANNRPLPGRCLVFHRSPCQPVTQFEANASSAGIRLSWQPSLSNYTSYRLEYGLRNHGGTDNLSLTLPRGTTSHFITNLSYGQTYDFYITPMCSDTWAAQRSMTTATMPCHTLTGLRVTPSESALFVSWAPIDNTLYRMEYGPRGFRRGNGTLVTGIATSGYIIRDLQPATIYDIYVEPLCNGTPGYGMMASAALSSSEADICDTASSFTARKSGSTAILSWTPAASNSGLWQVEYGPVGFAHGEGTLANISTTTYQIYGIDDTAIHIYLRAQCSDNLYSDWSAPRLLLYPAPLVIDNADNSQVIVSPNPVQAGTPLTISLAGEPSAMTLLDIMGHTIYATRDIAPETQLPTDKLTSGTYILQIAYPTATIHRKIVVR